MTRKELKQLIREVIEEVGGKYWDLDEPLQNLPFNIIAGEEEILSKRWFDSTVDHIYYRKEDDFLRLDGSYKTQDGKKGRFAVFVEKDGKVGAETNGDIQGHYSGNLKDPIPFNPQAQKPKYNFYLSTAATKLINSAKTQYSQG